MNAFLFTIDGWFMEMRRDDDCTGEKIQEVSRHSYGALEYHFVHSQLMSALWKGENRMNKNEKRNETQISRHGKPFGVSFDFGKSQWI